GLPGADSCNSTLNPQSASTTASARAHPPSPGPFGRSAGLRESIATSAFVSATASPHVGLGITKRRYFFDAGFFFALFDAGVFFADFLMALLAGFFRAGRLGAGLLTSSFLGAAAPAAGLAELFAAGCDAGPRAGGFRPRCFFDHESSASRISLSASSCVI